MESFTECPLLEQIRRERLLGAQRRRLRHALGAKRNLLEARLDERRLREITSRPELHSLGEEIQALVSFAFVRDRSVHLTRAMRSVQRRNLADRKIAEIRAAPAGSKEQ